jgi:imidazolonepropionase-like amidohydrolase
VDHVCRSLGPHGRASAVSAVPRDTVAAVTAFVNVSVIPMDRERVLTGQTVLVQGGRITALGPMGQVRVPAGALRIDGRGKFLIPGLADMHTHIAEVDSADAEHVLLLMLSAGVTTIRNMDYDPDNAVNEERMLRFRARASAGALLSPRIYTSGPWGPKQYTDREEGPPPVWDSVAAYVTAYKAAGYDHVKIHQDSRAIVDSVLAAAHRIGIPVVGHLPEGDKYGFEYALTGGYKSIEHLDGYGKQDLGVPEGNVDSAAIDTMPLPALVAAAAATQRSGVWNCPTQAVAEWYWYISKGPNSSLDTRQSGGGLPLRRRTIKALQAAGAGLLLGTDDTHSRTNVMVVRLHKPTFAVQDELAALVRAGLTPYQALVTGTRNAAAYFGTSSETGTVEVGKRADLVLLDGNPLADIANASQIGGVVLYGRWLSRADLDRRLAAIADPPTYAHWRPTH